jgi:translocator protein
MSMLNSKKEVIAYANKRNINWFHLILSIVVVELIGSLSGLLAGNIRGIYTSLKLPPLSPPAAVFGPVWIILYLLIGVAGYLVIKDTTSRTQKTINLSLFGSQLLLNFIWSIVFFGGNSYWLGLIIIIVLDLVVLACILAFRNVNKLAAYLFVPYFVWILFATYLTLGVAMMN